MSTRTGRESALAQPLFSIVTVCLNNLDGLRRTRASLDVQTCRDIQWIVVDGASGDGTPDYLAGLDDPCVEWSSEPDAGLYDAMNKGLERTRGRFVLFLNSGDCLASPGILERLAAVISEQAPGFIYGDAIETDDGDNFYKKAFGHRRIWYGMFTHHQAMLYRRDRIGNLRYDLRLRIAADWAFTRAFLEQRPAIAYLPEAICRFERGGLSFTARTQADRELWIMYRRVLGMPLAAVAGLWLLRRSINWVRGAMPWAYSALRFSRGTHPPARRA